MMCELCMTDCEVLIQDVLPGWSLVRARRDGHVMRKGQWGLVIVNTPSFVWSDDPVPDPFFDLGNEEFEKLTKEELSRQDGFIERMERFDKTLLCHPQAGHNLVEAAMKTGYDREKHGTRLAWWLFHHLGCALERKSCP